MGENWDSIADWYAALVRGSPMHRFSRDILLSVLPPNLAGLNMLDIGCGEGLITRALAERGVTALGVDPTALVNRINRIERELGMTLLIRAERGRPMKLTECGASVVAAVRGVASARALGQRRRRPAWPLALVEFFQPDIDLLPLNPYESDLAVALDRQGHRAQIVEAGVDTGIVRATLGVLATSAEQPQRRDGDLANRSD